MARSHLVSAASSLTVPRALLDNDAATVAYVAEQAGGHLSES
jgi:hypothetical protein